MKVLISRIMDRPAALTNTLIIARRDAYDSRKGRLGFLMRPLQKLNPVPREY